MRKICKSAAGSEAEVETPSIDAAQTNKRRAGHNVEGHAKKQIHIGAPAIIRDCCARLFVAIA